MIFGKIKTWLALIGAGIIAVAVAFLKGKRSGTKREQADAAIKAEKARERGREAVSKGRESGLAPDERVRRNDGRWM